MGDYAWKQAWWGRLPRRVLFLGEGFQTRAVVLWDDVLVAGSKKGVDRLNITWRSGTD